MKLACFSENICILRNSVMLMPVDPKPKFCQAFRLLHSFRCVWGVNGEVKLGPSAVAIFPEIDQVDTRRREKAVRQQKGGAFYAAVLAKILCRRRCQRNLNLLFFFFFLMFFCWVIFGTYLGGSVAKWCCKKDGFWAKLLNWRTRWLPVLYGLWIPRWPRICWWPWERMHQASAAVEMAG